jgi:hypothetical protein
MKDVITILSSARDLIAAPGGYIKGLRKDHLGGYCALGALTAARKNLGVPPCDFTEACEPANLALEPAIPSDDRKAMESGKVPDAYNDPVGLALPKVHLSSKIACYSNNGDQKKVVEWFDRAIQIQHEHPMEKL